MEIVIFLVVIFILFVLLSIKSKVSDGMLQLNEKIDALTRQINNLKAESKSEPKTEEFLKDRPPVSRTEQHSVRPVQEEKKPDEPKREEIKVERPLFVPPSEPKPVQRVEAPVVKPPIPVQKKPGFFERNPDLEKFIGENLANKIGIAILVIGIGFFVKYAIDKEWINEIGRVFIGILCGGILLGIAHKLRKTFAPFSSVLVGGGIAVLYFTIAIAFHEYHIFNQAAAFILMVVITGFTIVLSLGYNRVELAVLAILGGFGSPFMVSTGEGNYVILFSYMLILNGGMLVLAYHKKWKIVNIVCYVFTIIIFASWLSARFNGEDLSMIRGGILFATFFYLIFFLMNVINNIRQQTKFEAVEMLMLLSNTFLYYSAGMVILNNPLAKDFQGLFTTLLGVFNFSFAYVLYKKASADRNLVFMLIGLVLTFISLAAPIQLEGNYITLFWAAEAVLLLWLSQKSGIKLMKIASVVVLVLMVVSLLLDWKQIYIADYSGHMNVILNKGFITGFAVLVSLILTFRLLNNEKEDSILLVKEYKVAITIAGAVILYFTNLLELRYHLAFYVDSYASQSVIVGTYNMQFILLLLLAENRITIPDGMKKLFPLWSLVAIGAYLFYYHGMVVESRDQYLMDNKSTVGFVFHYVLVALLITIVSLAIKNIQASPVTVQKLKSMHWWLFIFFFIFIASAELDHVMLIAFFTDIQSSWSILEEVHKIGYPILWGLSSFILIALGLKEKIKALRIISLVLLLVTLLKLFFIDLRDISEGGKIAAFISLGILLLVVSFMYQRLKKLLLEDSPAEKIQDL